VQDPELWLTLLNALLFWAVATFALLPRLGRGAVRDLFACFLLTATAVAVSGPPAPRGGLGFLLPAAYLAALSLMPPLFWRFSLAFPRPMPFLCAHGRLVRWAPLLGAAIAAWNVEAQLAWFAVPSPERFDALALPMRLLQAQLVLGMLAGIVTLYRNGRGAQLAREKRQAKWILWGIAIGATPFVFLRILPRLFLTGPDPVDPAVDRAVEMTIPLAITIAVVRERFADIDVIIRRSVIYTLLALGAVGVVFLVLLLAGRWARLPEEHAWALAVAIPAALFLPARQWVSRWVDRTFFRIRHGHAQALAALRRALAPAAEQAEIARTLCRFLQETLDPKRLAVLLRNGAGWAACGDAQPDEARGAIARLAPLGPEFGVLLARRNATAVPEVERDDFDPEMADAGLHLAQPVARHGRALGLLLLGERTTERRYVEEDLRLLAAAADLAGEAVERLELVQRVAEESMGRRALADLARQKADFFARVAHDLRTPLTAIRWSVRNLEEGLAGPLSERQADYLGSVTAAAGQLGRLVDNLVDLGRLDLDAPRPPPEPVDLGAVVSDAARALRPLAEAARVHVALDVARDLPCVRARPEAAYQIVINLLDNAIKYAPEDTAIDVRTAPDGAGAVELSVRDRGPGLPPAERERVFRLFERGPEGPRGPTKGFGIGLHVVKAWTDSFGGTVTVDDHPDGGARFTCRLPVWRPAERKEEA
jgi:two-component system sensor histidine kinase KdpD